MAKQLNVSLAFTADTGKAKAQLQDLQNQLDKLISGGGMGGKKVDFILTQELQQATVAAAKLQSNLKAATDVNTGKLDLSKFQAQMNQSGMSLEKYRNQLVALGPDGAKAFASLTDSIYNADVVLKRSSKLLTEMKTTLMNTARWQLSSSMLHGFIGAVQGAFGYAQDLNESLNNIRIVTGQNIDQMAKFAEEANKAAKALSTTTTNYTNASLIFYQQGLDDQQVKERADVTIKLANVARISAETASDQLTAIWNNFAEGSDNLEHFADVLVKLGAETASSSAEISQGLEKFAAIGDTIGLSYENAAAALATVTATTRQSADVVGTAFKTIFARIQGLNLGETLDDGTTLNKYSQALNTVGISIKDQNGELKNMDVLLEEMGSKWQTMSRDQQTALAQTVAGVRQYTQLMALMNNWDFYKQNLATANSADGTLEEQQKIYEESWEAAQQRVKAASQTIYQELIDDEFFIDLLDGFKEVLEFVDHLIDAFGGLKGVLSVIGTLLLKSFSNEIAQKIDNIGRAVTRTAGGEKASAIAMKKEAVNLTGNMGQDWDDNEGKAMNAAYTSRQQAQTLMLQNADRLSEAEKGVLQILMDGNKALGEQVIAQGKLADEAEREANNKERALKVKHKSFQNGDTSKKITQYKEGMIDVGKAEGISGALSKATGSINKGKNKDSGIGGLVKQAETLRDTLNGVSNNPLFKGKGLTKDAEQGVNALYDKISELSQKDVITEEDVADLREMAKSADELVAKMSIDLQDAGANDAGGKGMTKKQSADLQELGEQARNAGVKAGQAAVGMNTLGQSTKMMGEYVDGAKGKVATLGQKITAVAQTITTTIMVINMLKGAMETIKDPEMSGWEKFLAVMGSVAMAIPMVVSTVTALGPAFIGAGGAAMTGGASMGAGISLAMGPIGWVIAAVTALIALFVALAIAAEQNSPEAKLAKASKTAEELSENLEDVRKEAQEIKNTFEKYDSLVDKLEQCSRGTEEWHLALQDVNDCILDLLDKYPQLAKYEGLFDRSGEGMITVDPDVVEDVLKDLDTQVNTATAAALLSSADATQVSVDNLRNSTKSEIGSFIGTKSEVVGSGQRAYTQYEYVEAGKILTEHAEELANLTEKEYKEKIEKLLQTSREQAEMTDEQWNKMIDALMDDQEAINKLVRATNQAATQMDNATLALANQALANGGYDNAETMMASMGLETEYQTIYDDIVKKGKADWQSDTTTTTSKDIWKRFEEATGKDYQEIDNTVQGDAAGRKYAYKDDAGDEKTFSLEYMAKTIAAYEAMSKLTDNADKASESLVNVETVNRKYAESLENFDADEVTAGIKSWITTGSFGDMTAADFMGLENVVSDAGGVDAYLQEAFGMTADELAVTFGEDYVDKFSEGMENYTKDFADVGKDLLVQAQEDLKTIDTSNLTLNQKEVVGEVINAAIVNSGTSEAFTNLFNSIPVEQSDEFAEVLRNVDWQTTDVNQLRQALADAGVSTTGLDDKLQALIDTMDNGAIKAASTLGAEYKKIADVADGLQTGDTISAEDYGQLDEGMKRYFTMMMDGTYALTGSAEAFQELVHKQGIAMYQENIQKLGDQAAGYNRIKGYDVDALKESQYKPGEGYSSSGVTKQLDLLETMGYDAEKLAQWREDMSDSNMTHDNLDAITAAVKGYSTELENLDVLIEENRQAVLGQEMAIAMSYGSLEELNKAYQEGVVSVQAYNTAAMALNEKEDLEGLDSKELEDYADYLQEICKESDDLADSLAEDDEAARDVAKTVMKMNKGIDALADGFKDWSSIMKKSSKESEEYSDAVNGMRDALSDVLDVSGEYISADFMKEHLEDIELAAKGNADAIDRLKAALADQIILDIVGVDKFSELPNGLQTAITNMQNIIANTKLDIGETIELNSDNIDTAGFLEACNEVIANANMTADQANAYFDALGFETNFVTEPQLQTQRVPEYVTETIDEGSTTVTLADGTEVPMVKTRTRTYQDGYYEAEGMVDAIAMATSTDGSTQVPQIQSIRKKPTGSANNYSSKNSGGTKTPGGNSSGGDKKAKKESKKNVKTETDRYHVLENQLENLTSQYDAISKAKDRAFGKAKLALMDQEIAKQKQIIAKQKEYLDVAKKNLSTDANALGKYNANIVDGVVTNYDQVVASQVQKYNDAVDKYNALSAEAQEKLDEEWSNKKDENGQYYSGYLDYYEKQYQEFTDALSQYEETQDLVRDKQQEIIDAENELYDLHLEKIDYKVNLQIEFSDDELSYLEYLLEKIENRAFSAADAIANLGYQTKAYFNQNDAYEQGIKDIFGNHGLTDDDFNKWMSGDQATIDKIAGLSLTENEVEKLREYRDGLMETSKSLIEVRQAVHDNLLSSFEEANEKIDAGIEKLEHYQAVTESYKNIVDLVGKANFKDSDKAIKALNESTINQAKNVANATIAKRDMIQAELDAAREAYDQQKNKISAEERKMWEDTIQEMEKSLMEAEESAMSSIEEWMQAVNDKFISEIEQAMDKFSETVAGKFKNLTELQEAFERSRTMTEMYLEDYEKIYEFSKLNRDIEKSIDETDNVRAKKELLALQEEINELEESGAEVSEYQMENLRKRYELKLAELALDEAKNAKSQVRMTMDNEGNWGYVYTADDAQVESAEQAYEDKLFELQQHNAEYINQLQEDIINMQVEMREKLEEIANDESLSIEERQAKMAEVQAFYQEKMNNYASELGIVLDNNKILYTEDWTAYSERTDYKISDDEKYVDSFQETDLAILTGFENMADYQQNFNDASAEMLVESNQAFDDWEDEMDEALDAAGLDMDDLADDIEEDLSDIDKKSDELTQAIEEDAEAAIEAFEGVVDAVVDWETQYSESVQNMITESELLIEKFNEVLALWANVKSVASEDLPTPAPDSDTDPTDGDATPPPSSGTTDDGMPPDNSSKAEGVAAAIWMDGGATSGWYNGSDRSSRLAAKGVTAAQAYINKHGPNGDIYRSWVSRRGQLKNYYYGAFDTGGYTGEWGPDGKFAMLHEKELVLNKEDTGNILSAVNMIREISNMIDLNAMSASHGLTSLLGVGGIKDTSNKLEQTVTIHAEFPGVQNHSEIEEAFNNLINTASQYANRKL